MKAFQSSARRAILDDSRARAELRGIIQQRRFAVAGGSHLSLQAAAPSSPRSAAPSPAKPRGPAPVGTVSTSGGLTFSVRIIPTR